MVLGHGVAALWPWLLFAVLLAATKEFVYDILVESPQVSGLWIGGLEDFAGYVAGMGVGLLTLLLSGAF